MKDLEHQVAEARDAKESSDQMLEWLQDQVRPITLQLETLRRTPNVTGFELHQVWHEEYYHQAKAKGERRMSEINKDWQIADLQVKLKEANDKNTWIKKQQESWNSTTKETIKDLERQLEEEKAKSKALLAGLEVQNFNDFINRANVENYKQLGESITASYKQQLKEQG